MLEHITPDIALSKSYHQLPCVFRYVECHVDKFIDHRPVPAAFYRPFLSIVRSVISYPMRIVACFSVLSSVR